MTTHERFTRMFEHKEADRVPIIDSPWNGTIHRWQREGMPVGADWRDYFAVDKVASISVDITPRYESKVLEETDDYSIYTSPWGVTMKEFKQMDSTPEFIDFTVVNPEQWAKAKSQMTVSRDRVNWKYLEANYDQWKAEGRWIEAGFWFGFDVAHSWMVGTETLLMAMVEEPEWVQDMFNHYLDMCIAHFDMIWDAGYRFDSIFWPDDMGYKNTTFFSTRMYRELLKPVHKRAADWAHAKGIKAHLHSCGYILPHLPDVIDAGIDALNPIERKAGMDVLKLKQDYGDKLVLHGGINAVLWDDKDKIIAEIESLVPHLKVNGGYIFSSDHSIPNSVSLENFKAIVEKVKQVGKY
jgi:uroporphyrinogen decarboxylase